MRWKVRWLALALGAMFVITACDSNEMLALVTPLATSTTPVNAPTTTIATSTPSTADVIPNNVQEEAMPNADELVSLAKQDLAERLSISVAEISLLEVRTVTWPDTSLGCAEPGQMYAQVMQDGFLIRLRAGEQMYFYHSGPDQKPFLCERTAQIIPRVPPATDEFVPPPDSEID